MDKKFKVEELEYVFTTPIQKSQGIRTFHERPCEGKYLSDDSENNDEISANQLFSIFTADIIKEEVLFTR